MTIHEEFDKAFEKEYAARFQDNKYSFALWAAKWMAERLRQEAKKQGVLGEVTIRQLAKELDGSR